MDNKTLIENIVSATGQTREDVQEVVSAFCKLLPDVCLEGDSVIVSGFGQFESRKRKERLTVHPASGERLMVPPKIVMKFRPSAVLNSRIVNRDKPE
ncbi:MAG: HU family DNA-binding protein [Muribaculaceae bacterium]|nr:HU family DNA-binding protein [Muribaculaceae bacterium]